MAPKIPEMLIQGRERELFSAFALWDIVKEKTALDEADIDHYMLNLEAPGSLNGLFEYYRSYPQDVKNNFRLKKKTL